jgi:hypothetical protein
MPWIESWDFKGSKVLPGHATLPIPDNVIYLDAIRKLGGALRAVIKLIPKY